MIPHIEIMREVLGRAVIGNVSAGEHGCAVVKFEVSKAVRNVENEAVVFLGKMVQQINDFAF